MNKIEKQIQEEVNRYNEINKYGIKLTEQVEGLPPPVDPVAGTPPVGDIPPPPAGAEGDVPLPPDATGDEEEEEVPVDPAEDDETEEMDITDLVNMTKNIKQELEGNKTGDSGVTEKMDGIFSKLAELEAKLGNMDQIIGKIDELGSKVSEMKPQTPQEKLEMRSLDSYPFNEKPDEFFSEKQDEMKKSGKNEYVLTKDDIENYNKDEIRTSFNDKLNDDRINS